MPQPQVSTLIRQKTTIMEERDPPPTAPPTNARAVKKGKKGDHLQSFTRNKRSQPRAIEHQRSSVSRRRINSPQSLKELLTMKIRHQMSTMITLPSYPSKPKHCKVRSENHNIFNNVSYTSHLNFTTTGLYKLEVIRFNYDFV